MLRHLTSSEATATVSYIISQVTSTDITISIQSLAQVSIVFCLSSCEFMLYQIASMMVLFSGRIILQPQQRVSRH